MPSLEDMSVDQLLEYARGLEPKAQLIDLIGKDSESRNIVQGVIKKLKPDTLIPEFDARQAVRAEIEDERKERKKLEQKLLEREARDNVRERREAIKAKYRLTDADVEEVEKLMIDKENPIPTHDAAARVYLASKTPSTPTPASYKPPTYTMPEKDVWGAGIGNPAKLNKIALDEAFRVFNEFSVGQRPGM